MQQYIRNHLESGAYNPSEEDACVFENTAGWRDYLIGEHLLYSHRVTDYTKRSLAETHHFHESYELQFFLSGDVDYVCGAEILSPRAPAAVWFCPGEMHNTRMLKRGVFDRVVFRFSPEAFSFGGKVFPLCDLFLREPRRHFCPIPESELPRFTELFRTLDHLTGQGEEGRLYAFAATVELLRRLALCVGGKATACSTSLPRQILAVKNYIDENYDTIGTVSEVAEHFFYSREYLSRLFRRYCNTTVAEYLTRYRLRKSLPLLQEGRSVSETCFAVGFGSMSPFIAAFKKYMGLLPSEYAKQYGKNRK